MAGEELMAGLETGNFLPMLSGAGAGAWDVIFIVLLVGIVAGVGWFALYWSSFKHTIMIREVTANGRKFMIKDKAKIRTSPKDGVEYWYLRDRKVELVSPKSDSVEMTKKGKFYAECYHDLESGKDAGYSWVTDNGEGNFISYPAEHRALLSARIRRAAERRGKNSFEMIMTIAAITIPLIALIVTFSFWGDLTSSTVDAQKDLTVAMKDFSNTVSDYACNQKIVAGSEESKGLNEFSSDKPLDQQLSAEVGA